MAMFKFGNTMDPCGIVSNERAQLPEEIDEKGNLDPDRIVQCPFDKNHQIRVCRFPYHLIKCRKNHPKLANELKTCPFNACHLMPKNELTHHIDTCENRMSLDPGGGDEVTNGHVEWQVPPSTWVNPNQTEDWDDEIDDHAPTFKWGQNNGLNRNRMMRPAIEDPGLPTAAV
ncbi:gametocyte-specific factor 1 isoform X1 [Platichthys flesus]|uniref:gametocyte-specific factor 1 isoform X1 n=1 Tax=Platichthys flesus TaxID=8260 RepID=UPI002DBFD45E|nr:gametocyte-specific factor 1 isoform X1 [Platichthys flesus]